MMYLTCKVGRGVYREKCTEVRCALSMQGMSLATMLFNSSVEGSIPCMWGGFEKSR